MQWYKKYKRLNSALFIRGNSGAKSNAPPPYSLVNKNGDLVGIEDKYKVTGHTVVGYTENPPFVAEGYESVAILFENANFERYWWHYPKDESKRTANNPGVGLVSLSKTRGRGRAR